MASLETSALQYMNAPMISPNFGSSIPQTHDSRMFACRSNAFSTSRVDIFSPPLIINDFFRSTINR